MIGRPKYVDYPRRGHADWVMSPRDESRYLLVEVTNFFSDSLDEIK